MFIIDFLNEKGGAIIVIATVFLVYITYRYLLETKKIRETSQEMLRVSNTPVVQVSLSLRSGTLQTPKLDLCIENIGTGFAYGVKFGGTITAFSSYVKKVYTPSGNFIAIKVKRR